MAVYLDKKQPFANWTRLIDGTTNLSSDQSAQLAELSSVQLSWALWSRL